MNTTQRQKLNKVYSNLTDCKDEADTILSALQETFDNHSEKWSESEAAETAQEQIENLESAVSSIEEAMEYIDNATSEQ